MCKAKNIVRVTKIRRTLCALRAFACENLTKRLFFNPDSAKKRMSLFSQSAPENRHAKKSLFCTNFLIFFW